MYSASASGGAKFQFAWSCPYTTGSKYVDTNRHTIRLFSDGTTSYMYIDGENCGSKATADHSSNTYSLLLFRGAEGNTVKTGSGQKIWSCKMTNTSTNETLLDLVPAMRNSDNEVGFYDLVGNTFLTNAGSGTFSYGTL